MTTKPVVVLATRNGDKVAEFSRAPALAALPIRIVGLDAYPDLPPVEETGGTFVANAVQKARHAAAYTGRWALADDSGLEVDALDGGPGVRSARFAGPDATAAENNEKLLRLLEGVPAAARTARFRAAVAIASPTGVYWVDVGDCSGLIAEGPRGRGGFGYDPLFVVPAFGKTFAELPPAVKDNVSHRARALEKTAARLAQLFNVSPAADGPGEEAPDESVV